MSRISPMATAFRWAAAFDPGVQGQPLVDLEDRRVEELMTSRSRMEVVDVAASPSR